MAPLKNQIEGGNAAMLNQPEPEFIHPTELPNLALDQAVEPEPSVVVEKLKGEEPDPFARSGPILPTTTVEFGEPIPALPTSFMTSAIALPSTAMATTILMVEPIATSTALPGSQIVVGKSRLSPEAIGLIVGAVILCLGLVVGIVLLNRRRLHRHKESEHDRSSRFWAGMFQPSKPACPTISAPIPLVALQAGGTGTSQVPLNPLQQQPPLPPLPAAPRSLPNPSTFLERYNARIPSPTHPPPPYPKTIPASALIPKRPSLRRSITNSLRSALEFNNRAYDFYAVERERELARSRALAQARQSKASCTSTNADGEMVDVCLGEDVVMEQLEKAKVKEVDIGSWNEVKGSMSPFPVRDPLALKPLNTSLGRGGSVKVPVGAKEEEVVVVSKWSP